EAALDGRGEAVDLFPDGGAGRFGGPGGAALRGEREPDLQVASRSPFCAGPCGDVVGGGGARFSAGGDRRGGDDAVAHTYRREPDRDRTGRRSPDAYQRQL